MRRLACPVTGGRGVNAAYKVSGISGSGALLRGLDGEIDCTRPGVVVSNKF